MIVILFLLILIEILILLPLIKSKISFINKLSLLAIYTSLPFILQWLVHILVDKNKCVIQEEISIGPIDFTIAYECGDNYFLARSLEHLTNLGLWSWFLILPTGIVGIFAIALVELVKILIKYKYQK